MAAGYRSGLAALAVALSLASGASAAEAAKGCHIRIIEQLEITTRGLSPYVKGKINGHDLDLLVDTGAFFSAVGPEAATKIGERTELVPNHYVIGVGGREQARRITTKTFEVGRLRLSGHQFVVLSRMGGDGILGQNVLRATDAEFDLANGTLRFIRRENCGRAAPVYWSDAFTVIDIEPTTEDEPHLRGDVYVNGRRIRAMFDTGATTTALSLRLAKSLGLSPTSEGATSAGAVGGIGKRLVETFVVPVETISIGGETIRNTKIRVSDFEFDMLVGADFFLSHRVYIAYDQRKMYFTYNGGPVFRLEDGGASPNSAATPLRDVAEAPSQPKTADDFSRRAAASTSRRDFKAAVADLSEAVKLDPQEGKHLVARAQARLASGDGVLAMADLDQALKLKAEDHDALLTRGMMFLRLGDEERAAADFAAAERADARVETLVRIGGVYQATDRHEGAVRYYDRWIAANPKHPNLAMVQNNRCWSRAILGRELDLALADCNAAVRAQRIADFYDSRGLVYFRRGELDAAMKDYDTALGLQPKLAPSLYGRDVVRIRQGRRAEGEADLKAAVALEPKIDELAKKLGLTP